MQSLTIGIYFHSNRERLEKTLAGLRAEAPGIPVVLLDGVGTAACFNQLAAACSGDVLLLESGVVPGPGSIAALHAGYALAGPSTNLCWNDQGSLPGGGESAASINSKAAEARARFGTAVRTLEPLYSLADFCYLVRREVIDVVGGADEGYGTGPCWEMDYNVRAARAGFEGVWVCGAYVYRPPAAAERVEGERRGFAAARARYQDKFCGRRLRGGREAYRAHCRGDACENFAPRDLRPIEIATDLPLVSCVMATRGRPQFVRRALEYFERQDYPNRELIILDDDDGSPDAVVSTDRVRYVRMPRGTSIGAKRNRGCELARGSIIAQWDDDDWYGAGRLSAQVAPLRAGQADISGFIGSVFFDLPSWKFWQCSPALHRWMFVEDVHGGTLVYRKSCWGPRASYPDRSIAEDAMFLRAAMRGGARLARMESAGLFVYLRHGGNSWSFECGKYPDASGWLSVGQPSMPSGDVEFYRSMVPGTGEAGLVSCIMPTYNRRRFVPQAIRYFLRQDYPNRELIIVDDGADTVGDLAPADPRIRYERLPSKKSIGAKRNLACELARGSLIVHWDDDDWMADWRLSYQVSSLTGTAGKEVCGLSGVYYFAPRAGRSWFYQYPAGGKSWVAGNTLCYRKDSWRAKPFADVNEGEDTQFVWARAASSILALTRPEFYVGMVHECNASPKRTNDPRWQVRAVEQIRGVVGADFGFYEAWDAAGPVK